MSKDYYKILGVERNASKDDIKKAFRKLAHQHHPDKGGGEESSKKFKEASEAYSVLSDDNKRKQYDMFGSAGPGGAGFNGGAGGFGGFNPQDFGGFDFSGFARQAGQGGFGANGVEFDLGDIFSEFFGGGRGRRPRKGATITIDLQISFKESIFGADKDVSVNGQNISIRIPAGIESGQGLRVPGKGEQGEGGPGDLIVRVWVTEHPFMRKERLNLVTDLEVKLTKALLGGSETIETLEGSIEIKIPPGTNNGDILRVRGKGVPYSEGGGMFGNRAKRGDLLVVIHIIMPKKLSKNAQKMIDDLKKEGL
jgi:DnaJ-class molecular chaperone